jgi:hypothetical protein
MPAPEDGSPLAIALALSVSGAMLVGVTAAGMAGRALAQESQPKPGKKGDATAEKLDRMDLSAFWSIIEEVRVRSRDDQDFLRRIGPRLEVLKAEELVAFRHHLTGMLAQSKSWALWGAARLITGGCADDCFDRFRAWLISQGQQPFTKAVEDPDALAALAGPSYGDVRAFEAFLSLPGDFYEDLTGEEMPDSAYVSVAPPKLGERWDFEDKAEMRRRYPRLFAKYGRRPSR